MDLKTMVVKFKKQQGDQSRVVINADDFNPEEHEEVQDDAPSSKAPETKFTARSRSHKGESTEE